MLFSKLKKFVASGLLFALLTFGAIGEEISDRPLQPKFEIAKQIYTDLAWATYLQSKNRLSEAKLEYEKIRDLVETSAFVRTQLAKVALGTQDLLTAENEARRAIELNPNDPTSHFVLAQTLLKRAWQTPDSDWKNVITEFEKTIELEPDYVEAHRFLGEIASVKRNPDLAVRSFKELTRLMPYHPIFYLRLGRAYEEIGEDDSAISAYKRSTKIDPKLWQAYEGIGRLRTKQFEIEEKEILNADPPSQEQIASAETKLKNAISAYEKMRQFTPKEPAQIAGMLKVFKSRLASFYLSFDQTENSIRVLEEIYAEDQDDANTNYLLGLSFQEIENFEKAEQHLRNAIRLAPDRSAAYNALGYLFVELEFNLDYAIELIKIALEKEPQNGAYLDSLGWAFFKKGRYDQAIIELEKAIKLEPNSWEIQDHLGDAYHKKGLISKAISAWRCAIKLHPESDSIQQKIDANLDQR